MTNEGAAVVISDELERADEELRAADALRAAGLPRVAVTRTYFAAFHAVRALLYAHALEPRSHHGALALFNMHFVRVGTYEAATSRLLSRLQRYREDADYGTGVPFDDAAAREEIEATRALVARLTGDTRTRLAEPVA